MPFDIWDFFFKSKFKNFYYIKFFDEKFIIEFRAEKKILLCKWHLGYNFYLWDFLGYVVKKLTLFSNRISFLDFDKFFREKKISTILS